MGDQVKKHWKNIYYEESGLFFMNLDCFHISM